jgi:hypothetical protein
MIDSGERKPPVPQVHLMNIGTGTGKSHEGRVQLKSIVGIIPEDFCVVIATPTHGLNDEHLDALQASLSGDGIIAAVYRGRGANDPNRAGHSMCDFAQEAFDLSAAGGDPKQLCSRKKSDGVVRCEVFDVCGYLKQNKNTANIWIVPFAVLVRGRPKCIPDIAALIIDEDPLQTFLGGFSKYPMRISNDELLRVRQVPVKPGSIHINDEKTADLEASMAALRRAVMK